MFHRLLPALLLAMPVAFPQSGFFGAPTGHPKAGDIAPDLTFTQVLSAPGPVSWSQSNLSGQFTIITFFPDTSHNPQPVAAWNERVDQYTPKHVQFIWITAEDQKSLLPALAQHPIKGWVLYDPNGTTAKAYGLDMPVNVYIGPNRKIIGFQDGFVPDEQTLNAVLEKRVVLTRPTPATLKDFRDNSLIALDSTPPRMPRAEDHRPHITPSFTVHITPSTTGERGNFRSADYWVLKGFTPSQAIEEIYGVNAARVDLPASLQTGKRYDLSILLPHPEQREQMNERFKQAFQSYFHVTVGPEPRLTPVYILGTVPGRQPSIEQVSKEVLGGYSDIGTMSDDPTESIPAHAPQSLDSLFGVSEEDTTMDNFCRHLEGSLDRPVVNETHLDGRYRFQVHIPVDSKVSFLTVLRDQTGLVITPGQRKITFLKFKPTAHPLS